MQTQTYTVLVFSAFHGNAVKTDIVFQQNGTSPAQIAKDVESTQVIRTFYDLHECQADWNDVGIIVSDEQGNELLKRTLNDYYADVKAAVNARAEAIRKSRIAEAEAMQSI